ncbi:ScyD/ScyE family protein [Longispora sp. K20-0274]|uniref:ScyD/ScyE family protein n=1 Tax=Longispora sp. K20-0274 TaxID=3088255 RepID=UPI003999E73B
MIALAVLLTTAVLPTGPAAATGTATDIEVVADGLNAPRGLVYDRGRDRVLVAEAGVATQDNGPCTNLGRTQWCYGPSGSVFEYTSTSQKRIVTGLPSIANATKDTVQGLHDVTLFRGRKQLLFGMNGRQSFHDGFGPDANLLGHTATFTDDNQLVGVGDLVGYEEANNPEPDSVRSNPFGMYSDPDGNVVADAGGNSVLLVKADGSITVLAALHPRVVNGGEIDSVPMAVTKANGAYYVAELSGFPYYTGEARIYRIRPGQAPTIWATGFTNIVDIAFDAQGRMLVLELARNGLLDPDQTGRLVRIEDDGSRTDLVTTGLTNPGGLAVGPGNVVYVTNRTTSAGGTGQLLKLTLHQ